MAHYGDPEAHRCILEEVAAGPNAPRLIAFLRAAVMGSQGSEVGLQLLRRFPGAVEQPGPHLRVTLALLSLTVLASAAKPSFRREQQQVYELLARERAILVQQGEQLKSNSCIDSGACSPVLWGVSSGTADVPVNLSCSDISSASATVDAATAAGSFLPVLSRSDSAEETRIGQEEGTFLRLQRWEQAMDILNYCEAYANYLSGFTVLWYELFGPHYYYNSNCSQGGQQREEGEEAEEELPSSPVPGEWTLNSSHSPPLPQPSSQCMQQQQRGPQVPPHLYAVHWDEILTPQRRAWFDGLHNVVKELLVRILTRELPLELYALFIQYANLSLRVYLLQTLAEMFESTSHYLDVLCYVHVMRQSYNIQCEMSELQRIWASFGLFDNRFFDECREFNKVYTESRGASSEHRVMMGHAQAVSGNKAGRPPPLSDTTTVSSGRLSQMSQEQQRQQQQKQQSNTSNNEGASHCAPFTYSATDAAASLSTVSFCSTTAPAPTAANAASDGTSNSGAIQRAFPPRGTTGNASSDAVDAVHSSTSSSPLDETLSSVSEAAADADAHTAKRAVYLPLFYTCCCFTWILQRSFWSMYGRNSLLLESCLGNEVAPQVLRVGVTSVSHCGNNTLFRSTSLEARRRGAVATGLRERAGAASNVGVVSTVNSTCSPHSSTITTNNANGRGSGGTVGGGSGRERRNVSGVGAIAPVISPGPQNESSRVESTLCQGGAAVAVRCDAAASLSSNVPRPLPQVQSQPQRSRRSTAAASVHCAAATAVTPSAGCSSSSAACGTTPSTVTTAASASGSARSSGEATGFAARWFSLLGKLVAKRSHHKFRNSSGSPLSSSEAHHRQNQEYNAASSQVASSRATASSPSPLNVASNSSDANMTGNEQSSTGATAENEEGCAAASASASLSLTCSGAPFFLQYAHRAREIQLYEDPSANLTGTGDEADSDSVFFREFHLLRSTGCYVLSRALRNLICYPRYPVTLLILTDNSFRPGRVSWCDHKFTVLSSAVEDKEERHGLTPWVLCAVIPHTRLSSDDEVRAQQEERLLQHVVFQVAGAKSSRVRFCASNSVFYALNGGTDMDGGRLYFVIHLHVPNTISEGGTVSTEQVMWEESRWAFRELGELHCGWAMPCTCNEALRVAFQVGPIDDWSVEV